MLIKNLINKIGLNNLNFNRDKSIYFFDENYTLVVIIFKILKKISTDFEDSYELMEVIGKGAYSIVHRCVKFKWIINKKYLFKNLNKKIGKADNKEYAIKIIDKSNLNDEQRGVLEFIFYLILTYFFYIFCNISTIF